MSKKFKFKLEGLLKLRKIKEDVCKQQLGNLQKDLLKLQTSVEDNNKAISDAHNKHLKLAAEGASLRDLSFFPFFISGKEAINRDLDTKIQRKNSDIESKISEQASLKNDHKLIKNMKEEKKIEHKKQMNKKELEKMEELTSIRRLLK